VSSVDSIIIIIIIIIIITPDVLAVWRSGESVGYGYINKVSLRQARLVWDGCMIVGSTLVAGNLSRSNQLPSSTQPGHPRVCRENEYKSMPVMLCD